MTTQRQVPQLYNLVIRLLLFLCLPVLIFGCDSSPNDSQPNIRGNWKVTSVTLGNGEKISDSSPLLKQAWNIDQDRFIAITSPASHLDGECTRFSSSIELTSKSRLEVDAFRSEEVIEYSFNIKEDILVLEKTTGAERFSSVTPSSFRAKPVNKKPKPQLSCKDSLTNSGSLFGRILFRRGTRDSEIWSVSGDGRLKSNVIDINLSSEPSISPDGSVIAFSEYAPDSDIEIYISNINRDSITRVTDIGGASSPDWSPNGSRIAFESKGTLYTVKTTGKDINKITDIPFGSEISWSPDGDKIAFVSESDGNPNIFTVRIDNGDVSQVTEEGAIDPSWAPDGSRIAFSSGRTGLGNDIYTIKPNGSQLRRLTTGPIDYYDPAWSPDAAQIAFFDDTIRKMNRDGTNQQFLINNGGPPDWGIQKRVTPIPTGL